MHQDAVSVHDMDAQKDGDGIAAFGDARIKVFLKEHKRKAGLSDSDAECDSSFPHSKEESRQCVFLLAVVAPPIGRLKSLQSIVDFVSDMKSLN